MWGPVGAFYNTTSETRMTVVVHAQSVASSGYCMSGTVISVFVAWMPRHDASQKYETEFQTQTTHSHFLYRTVDTESKDNSNKMQSAHMRSCWGAKGFRASSFFGTDGALPTLVRIKHTGKFSLSGLGSHSFHVLTGLCCLHICIRY